MGLPLAPNEDLNDDGASFGIPAHDLNVQLEQAMQHIVQLEGIVLAKQ